MKDLFNPEDFEKDLDPIMPKASSIASTANNILNAYTQCLEKVYGDIKLGSYHGIPLLWSVDEKPESTHVARIIVEKLQPSNA